MLKHVLDTNLKEYIHQAAGICGVSAEGFSGIRVTQNLLPVIRERGLVTIFWDGNFSTAHKLFDAGGKATTLKVGGGSDNARHNFKPRGQGERSERCSERQRRGDFQRLHTPDKGAT